MYPRPSNPYKDGDVLTSRPIRELEIEISPEYAETCTAWLKTQNCSMECVKKGFYLIGFPEGTREEARAGRSGHYTQVTYIVFLSGVAMPKYVYLPINETQRTRVTMGF